MGRTRCPTRGALLLTLLAAFAAIGLSTRLNTKNALSSREAAIEVARPTGKLLHETEKSMAALQRARIADGEWDDDSDDEELGMSDVDFLMLGISKKGTDPEDDPDYVDDKFCHKNRYRKRTFKVVKEMPFAGLFPTLQRTRRFEGSGIAYANGSYYVVFDSLKTLGRVDLRFSFRGPENRLVGPVGDESQFEGISYNAPSDSFFVLRESFEHEEHGLVPVVYELKLTEEGANYRLMETCMVRFQLQDVNKGFESLHVFERDGKRHMLGLCESNFCKTIIGPDPPGLQRGNGRLVWATYRAAEDQYDECIWNVEKVIVLPEDAFLLDYAAIAFHGDFGEDVAIVSQEDAAVWVGKFDWTEMEFVKNPIPGEPAGQIYHFPRTDDCHKQYCNVEGAAWIDAERLVLTSDKSKRIQDHRCMTKDQSVHIMSLP